MLTVLTKPNSLYDEKAALPGGFFASFVLVLKSRAQIILICARSVLKAHETYVQSICATLAAYSNRA